MMVTRMANDASTASVPRNVDGDDIGSLHTVALISGHNSRIKVALSGQRKSPLESSII